MATVASLGEVDHVIGSASETPGLSAPEREGGELAIVVAHDLLSIYVI